MGILILIIVVAVTLLYLVYSIIASKVRMLLGYKLYEYTKIPAYGNLIVKRMWHKSDEEALKHYDWYEFVEDITLKPKRRIKPKKNENT